MSDYVCLACGSTRSQPVDEEDGAYYCDDCGEEMYPSKLRFTIECPNCTLLVHTWLVNDGKKIMQEACSCDCGWSKDAIEVTDLEFLDDEEN